MTIYIYIIYTFLPGEHFCGRSYSKIWRLIMIIVKMITVTKSIMFTVSSSRVLNIGKLYIIYTYSRSYYRGSEMKSTDV